MVYTSGVVTDLDREETLEELQDNKLTLVCEKLDLKPDGRQPKRRSSSV
jgi:cyclopropane fatty-acyl-phospholipid synthase-like methyltransferase